MAKGVVCLDGILEGRKGVMLSAYILESVAVDETMG